MGNSSFFGVGSGASLEGLMDSFFMLKPPDGALITGFVAALEACLGVFLLRVLVR
jgi:hypothetical protein